jgi:hypothetical protein
LFGRACRIACDRDERVDVGREREDLRLAAEAAAKPPAAPGGPSAKRIKFATVDQANDGEVGGLDGEKVIAAYARFEALTGGPPEPNEELTLDQLSSLYALLNGNTAPYVDFAVWGPYVHRIAKKVRMTGMVIGQKGELKNVEISGPSSYTD